MILEPAQQGRPQARLMRSPVGRRDRIAIGMDEAVIIGEPGKRPFERAMAAWLFDLAGENLLGDELFAFDILDEIILEAAGKTEHRLAGNIRVGLKELRCAMPADFDSAEKIGFGAGHLEETRGLEMRAFAENLFVGLEANLRPPAVLHLADLFELTFGMTALEDLTIEDLAARDFHFQALG